MTDLTTLAYELARNTDPRAHRSGYVKVVDVARVVADRTGLDASDRGMIMGSSV